MLILLVVLILILIILLTNNNRGSERGHPTRKSSEHYLLSHKTMTCFFPDPPLVHGDVSWLRTNGVNTDGGRCKVTILTDWGENARPGTFGKTTVG